MAKRPIGTYMAGDVLLTCGGCSKQDAFEQRPVRLWAGGGLRGGSPLRVMTQVICWNCGHVDWFARSLARPQ